MKHLTLCTVLMLWSGSAMATDTRMDALSGNLGMADDTDYQTFASQTDEASDNVWMDYDGANLGAAISFDSNAVSMSQGDLGTSFGWSSSSGDSGYSVGLDMASTDALSLSGSYSMSNGDNDMAFGGSVLSANETTGVALGAMSRTLTDSDVTAWGVGLGYNDGNIDAGGGYWMGTVMGGDASNAALTVGPSVDVSMPDGGDLAWGLSLVGVNLAGEFMFNDWIGIRGSATGSVDVASSSGAAGGGQGTTSKSSTSTTSSTTGTTTGTGGGNGGGADESSIDIGTSYGTAMGATFKSDAGAIDLLIDAGQLLGGPYFLTGAGTGPAIALSARFDI